MMMNQKNKNLYQIIKFYHKMKKLKGEKNKNLKNLIKIKNIFFQKVMIEIILDL